MKNLRHPTYGERVLLQQWATRLLIIFVRLFQLTSTTLLCQSSISTQNDCHTDNNENDEQETDEDGRGMLRLCHRVIQLNFIVANAEFGNENSLTSTFLIRCEDKKPENVVERMIVETFHEVLRQIEFEVRQEEIRLIIAVKDMEEDDWDQFCEAFSGRERNSKLFLSLSVFLHRITSSQHSQLTLEASAWAIQSPK